MNLNFFIYADLPSSQKRLFYGKKGGGTDRALATANYKGIPDHIGLEGTMPINLIKSINMEGTRPPTGASPTQPYKCGQHFKVKVKTALKYIWIFNAREVNFILVDNHTLKTLRKGRGSWQGNMTWRSCSSIRTNR